MFEKSFSAAALVIGLATAIIGAAGKADAGGFISDTFIRPLSSDLADKADAVNHDLGNPVDHAIAGAAESVVPGSGTALEGAWALQRSRILPPMNSGFGAPRPGGQVLGNFCMTSVGRFGPGPLNPVGMSCAANTPVGVVVGQITQ
jgi:hypothetical protein